MIIGIVTETFVYEALNSLVLKHFALDAKNNLFSLMLNIIQHSHNVVNIYS